MLFYNFIMLATKKIILKCNNIVQQEKTTAVGPQHLQVTKKDISLT